MAENSIDVAQMDAVGRLGVAIKRIAERDAEIERLRAERDTYVRKIIDETWGEALEDGSMPSTKLQDKIIAAVNQQQGKSDG